MEVMTMKAILLVSAALALLAGAAAGQDKPMRLTAAAPGSIFLEGEPVAFSLVPGGDAEVTYAVQDYDGESVTGARGQAAQFTLPPLGSGYYELEWKAGEQQGKASFAVLPSRPDEPPPSGPLAVDGAIAWLCKDDQWEPVAKMLRRSGIGWIRERLAWSGVAPEEGKFDWGKYQTVADALHGQGLRAYQIFHDSPGWTHPGKQTRNPDDLRHVYRFAREAGAHFADQILAWEPWNEPDIGFFDQPADKYSGIQKAAYLGFRAGNPDAPVLLCSLCRGRSAFSDNIFECGVADYMDIFNFHTYAPIERYVGALGGWVELTEQYGVADRPIWLTEAGVRLTYGADREELNAEQERQQAEFVPRSFAISLAAGVDRHFFFVLPFYPERGVQFGALHRDLSPRPAFVAIATAARLLGEGRYLGKLPGEIEGYVFDSGEELVAVVWADEQKQVKIPQGARNARVADLTGRERDMIGSPEGELVITAGPAAQYVRGLGPDVRRVLIGEPRPPGKLPELDPAKVVLVGHFDTDRIDKDSNRYILDPAEPIGYSVEAYNFDETAPARGTITLELPEGWTSDRREAEVSLEPMGREALAFQLTAKGGVRPARVAVRGDFAGHKVAPCVSYARLDITKLKPSRAKDLGLNSAARWAANISGNGKMEIKPVPDGGVSFPITFGAPGDRWCYPRVTFEGKQDWREFDGIALEYRFDTDDKGTVARVQVIEEGGSSYIGPSWPATKEWRRAVVLFPDLVWGSFSAQDPNGKLDLDQVSGLLVGCNTKLDKLTLEVRKVELVGYE